MTTKNYIISVLLFSFLILSTGCTDKFLNFYPEDKITSAGFPQDEKDIKLLLNGVYALLRETSIYDQGLFGFGALDGATPNAYNWGNTAISKIGNGSLSSSDGEIVTFRWKRCYTIIFRANYLLAQIENVSLSNDVKAIYVGEAHFLRGLAYSLLVESYGGVPIIESAITSDEARNLSRATVEQVWNQVIADCIVSDKSELVGNRN